MTSYPPLADVRKSLRVDWYRCPIEPAKLRELSKRSDLQGWFQAGGHLALYALTGFVRTPPILTIRAADTVTNPLLTPDRPTKLPDPHHPKTSGWAPGGRETV